MITQENIPYTADEIKAMVKKCEKYNAALERAKKLQETCDNTTVVGWCEYILPELKESEDEKTRKAILTGLIDCRDAPDLGWSNFGGINIDECIAWLENKKEPKDKGEISTSVNVRKKKATGVLGEMIANINPESLQKTKEQMTQEDFKARVSMAYEGREQWEAFLNRVWPILSNSENIGKDLKGGEV